MSNFSIFKQPVATKHCNDAPNVLLQSNIALHKEYNNLDYKANYLKLAEKSGTLLNSLLEGKSYLPFSYCVLEHILTSNELSHLEKLYYILADSLALINASSGGHEWRRAAALPAHDWARRLNCSKSQIFSLQKSLVSKSYFVIVKNHNKSGQNMRNLIMPTLPEGVFEDLDKTARVKNGEFSFFDQATECRRSYLDRTKLFVKINYQLLQIILADISLTPLAKIIWLDLFGSIAKKNSASLVISYQELAKKFSTSPKLVSAQVIALQEFGFLYKEQLFIKKDFELEARQDKSLWKISLKLPESYLNELAGVKNRSSYEIKDQIQEENICLASPLIVAVAEEPNFVQKTECLISDPPFPKFRSLLNKNLKINNYKDRSTVETNSLSIFSPDLGSNFYKKFNEAKFLKDFYPISKEDCSILQVQSQRDFSLNAMNEILLDMSKRVKTAVFYSKKGFLSYMSKVFTWEKRDAVKINNESFKIKSNQTLEEISLRNQERYLAEIENSLQVSPEWHLKKKLACVLKPAKSYELLRAYRSISRVGGSFKIYLDKYVDLSKLEQEIILKQIKATHEHIDLLGQEPIMIDNLEIQMPKQKLEKEGEKIKNKRSNNNLAEEVPRTLWSKIRRSLISKYGEAIDKNWFSKLEVKIDEENRAISLKTPSCFFKDWIERNYLESITIITKHEKYKVSLV